MRVRAIGVIAAILLAACVACTRGSSSPAAAPSSPATTSDTAAQLVASALRAATLQASVHYVQTTPLPRGGVGKSVGDAGAGQGEQHITDPTSGWVTTVVTRGNAFFRGNFSGLRSVGVPKRQAQAWADRWVLVRSSSPLYPAVTDQVTLNSMMPYITPTGPLRLTGTTTIQGMKVIAISGSKPVALNNSNTTGNSVLYLASSPPHLPVAFDYTPTHDRTERWLFSRWGEAVTVQSPTTGLTA